MSSCVCASRAVPCQAAPRRATTLHAGAPCLHLIVCIAKNACRRIGRAKSIEFLLLKSWKNVVSAATLEMPRRQQEIEYMQNVGHFVRIPAPFLPFTIRRCEVFSVLLFLCNFSCQTRQTAKEIQVARHAVIGELAERNNKFLCRKLKRNERRGAEVGSVGRGLVVWSRAKTIFFLLSSSICFSFRRRRRCSCFVDLRSALTARNVCV